MAKVSFTAQLIAKLGFLKTIESIKKKIGRKEFMQQIGDQIKDLIYADTKSGKGVADNGSGEGIQIRLASLSPKYIEYRRKKSKSGFSTGEFFRPNKSNLTFTGQMLDALKVDARQSFVKVFVDKSGRKDSDLTNAKVAEHVARNGRPFMGLTQRNKKIIDKEIERETRAIIRRELAR
jgi:hypothetical protein